MASAADHLGNRIREFRARERMTQADLAQSIGVSRKTINTVENQIYIPSTLLALKLAKRFNVNVEEIFFLINS